MRNVIDAYNAWLDTLEIRVLTLMAFIWAMVRMNLLIFGGEIFMKAQIAPKLVIRTGWSRWCTRKILEETVACDTPELYNSGVIYDPVDKHFLKPSYNLTK